jgi:protein-S-isoprenylcysteine O-methyltransferase Ste14
MDAGRESLLYDEFMVYICLACHIQGKLDMNIEKRNIKMFSIIAVVVLVAILLTAFGGFMMQRQIIPSRDSGMGINRGVQPQSAQTGPTGRLVMSTGILLLLVGFGVLVLMLWVWRTRANRNPS